jgi:hypothetical protein
VNSNDHLDTKNSNNHLQHATEEGSSAKDCPCTVGHQQEGLPLREAQNQKRKAISPTPQEEQLDQEFRDLEAIHQQVERKKEENASAV